VETAGIFYCRHSPNDSTQGPVKQLKIPSHATKVSRGDVNPLSKVRNFLTEASQMYIRIGVNFRYRLTKRSLTFDQFIHLQFLAADACILRIRQTEQRIPSIFCVMFTTRYRYSLDLWDLDLFSTLSICLSVCLSVARQPLWTLAAFSVS
jgi:hypothetical protein